MKDKPFVCPFCKGEFEKGVTIFTTKVGDGILVLENVPVELCSLCGEKWFSDEVVSEIEKIASSFRKDNIRIEVRSFSVA